MRQCAFLRIDGSFNMNQTKVSCKYLGIPFPIFYIKSMIHNACMRLLSYLTDISGLFVAELLRSYCGVIAKLIVKNAFWVNLKAFL